MNLQKIFSNFSSLFSSIFSPAFSSIFSLIRVYFKKIIVKYFGIQLNFRLRLFNALALGGLFACTLMSVINFFAGLKIASVLALLMSVIAVLLFLFTKITQKFHIAFYGIIIFGFLILFSVMFFCSGGYKSGMPIYFVLAVIFTTVMLDFVKAFIFISIEVMVYISLCVIAFYFPESVIDFATEKARLIDVILSVVIAAGICGIVFQMHLREYKRQIDWYKEKSLTDDLTSLGNRMAFRMAIEKMLSDKSDTKYFLAMLDIDNFKELNDTMGHDIGDAFLKWIASLLLSIKCAESFRSGGDEFLVLFKGAELAEVIDECKIIQKAFGQLEVKVKKINASVSIGIASWQKEMPIQKLTKNADIALYKAKETRNNIKVYGKY